MEKEKIYERYVSTIFSKEGRTEQESFNVQKKYYEKNFLPHLPKNKTAIIYDLACGLGHCLNSLRDFGYTNIKGVDFSTECVKFCKDNGLDVSQGDLVTFLQQNDFKADVFIMNDVWEHLELDKLILALQLIKEKLNPGGVLLAKVPNMTNPFLGSASRYIDLTHIQGFTEQSLSQLLILVNYPQFKLLESDIYVFANTKNYVAKYVVKFINFCLKNIFLLYGRSNTKIFSKHILVVAQK